MDTPQANPNYNSTPTPKKEFVRFNPYQALKAKYEQVEQQNKDNRALYEAAEIELRGLKEVLRKESADHSDTRAALQAEQNLTKGIRKVYDRICTVRIQEQQEFRENESKALAAAEFWKNLFFWSCVGGAIIVGWTYISITLGYLQIAYHGR